MDFEWDEAKRAQVLRERDVDLLVAARIFRGVVVTTRDERRDYGEERYRSVGIAGDVCYVVVHARRSDAVRLISAWKAGRSQRSQHQADLAQRDRGDVGAG